MQKQTKHMISNLKILLNITESVGLYTSVSMALLTGVLPSLIPLDEADNEEDQDEQSDGTHEANEPSLSGDVHLSARHSWPEEERKT